MVVVPPESPKLLLENIGEHHICNKNTKISFPTIDLYQISCDDWEGKTHQIEKLRKT